MLASIKSINIGSHDTVQIIDVISIADANATKKLHSFVSLMGVGGVIVY